MAIQYVDRNADAVGTVGDTYNITGTNNNLQITIDGGSAQNFVLTSGSARTAAQIVSDLSALTGATASVVTVNGVNYVRIRTTSAAGASSTILVGAPSDNANATLGFLATTYHGGANVNTIVNGSTKQLIINNVETALLSAGWVTVSGSGTTNLLMQSSMSPASQNLRMRIRLKDNGNNCTVCSIENVSGSKAGASSTSAGGQLLPQTGKGFRVVANKYQAFIFVPGSSTPRDYVAFGVPYLPSFLQGVIYEAIWLQGNGLNDTDTTASRGCFRNNLATTGPAAGYISQICNNNFWEGSGTSTACQALFVVFGAIVVGATSGYFTRWHEGSSILSDPLIGWGLSSNSDEIQIRGQLWDSFVSGDPFPGDILLSNVDSRNWISLTQNNTGNLTAQTVTLKGTLFLLIP